jgi:DNA repair protein RecO (recombination protein O)
MPVYESEAIVLQSYPLGEADRLVSFFSRTMGRMRGVAAGARRIKNRYGSTLEILSHVQLWYIEKETRDLVRIQQCELLESFHKSQSDYALSTGLAVVSEVSEQVLPDHEVAESMFRLLLLTVREVERTGAWQLPLSYFAFWTVRLGGWLPQFDQCTACGSPFGSQAAFHAPWEAGLLCEKCRRGRMKPLHLAARQLAERFAREKLDKIEFLQAIEQPAAELREASLSWIEHHTEKPLATRRLLETT